MCKAFTSFPDCCKSLTFELFLETTMNSVTETVENQATESMSLSTICHIAGYLSIVASIAIWYFAQGDGSQAAVAHAERFGLFVGLWAPTFFILSNKYDQK